MWQHITESDAIKSGTVLEILDTTINDSSCVKNNLSVSPFVF